jgi:hypothetical protein
MKPFILNLKNTIPSKSLIDDLLFRHKHIIMKNARFKNIIDYNKNYGFLVGNKMGYKQGTNNREDLGEGVLNVGSEPHFTYIHQHNEMSYTDEWPGRFMLGCIEPPKEGTGITTICDNRLITKELPNKLYEKALNKGIKYYRNFTNKHVDNKIVYNHWQDSFLTEDMKEVEKDCISKNINFKWNNDNSLKLEYNKPAFIYHPTTNEILFFNAGFQNQIFLDEWHPYNSMKKEDKPLRCSWGNGEEFTNEELNIFIRNSERNIIYESWEKGSIILLDNHYFTHGRIPYEKGDKREIGVIMGNKVIRSIKNNNNISACYYENYNST